MLDPAILEQKITTKLISLAVAEGFTMSTSGEADNTIDWVQRFLGIIANGVASEVVDHIKTMAVVKTQSGAPDGEHTGIIQ